MTTAVVVALALAVPLRLALPVLAAAQAPEAAVVVVAVLLSWEARRVRRRSRGSDEVLALLGMAAELRAGRTLKAAAVSGGDRAPGLDFGRVRRVVEAGRPGDEVAGALAAALPRHGRMAGAAFRVGVRSGGRMAEAFETAAALARAEDDLARERTAAAAQATAGAVVLVGLPLVLAGGRLATGGLGGTGGGLVGVGTALLCAGALVMIAVIQRSIR